MSPTHRLHLVTDSLFTQNLKNIHEKMSKVDENLRFFLNMSLLTYSDVHALSLNEQVFQAISSKFIVIMQSISLHDIT